jgi:hypothetical protein
MKATAKPDIAPFLSKHPMPKIDGGESVKDEPQPGYVSGTEVWVLGSQLEGPDVGSGIGACNDASEEYADQEDGLILVVRGGLEGRAIWQVHQSLWSLNEDQTKASTYISARISTNVAKHSSSPYPNRPDAPS